MKATKAVAAEIAAIEGFDVRFRSPDGSDVSNRRVGSYDYARAARHDWTVAHWHETRFQVSYPDYEVEVLDASGNPVHIQVTLSEVRASYHDVDEGRRHVPPTAQRTRQHKTARPPGVLRPDVNRVRRNAEPLGIEDTLWKAADKLRGSMDSSEYKHVVLGLVFLKYIDDAFNERRSQLDADLAADGFDREAINELLESRDEYSAEGVFWVPPDARWAHLQARAKQPGIGKLIDNAMDLVEVDNPTLRGVLPKSFSRPAIDVRRLGELVDLISGIGLGSAEQRNKDMLGRVYEYFLGRFASAEGKGGGEFYTPRSVVKLLVEMIEPYHGRVYDPCCGSGGMFVQSERFVEARGGQRNDLAVYGQESNDTTWRMAKMNLAIRGIEADLGPRWGDSFHEDLHPDLKADYILANPPFNISDWGGDQLRDDHRWTYGVPPAGNANYAWLEHMAAKLSPRGLAGIVLANGSLSSQTSGEGTIRRAMVEGDLVECIVALPGQLFYSTQIPVSLWFLSRDKSNGHTRPGKPTWRNRRGEILFIDCHNLGTLIDRTHRELTDTEIALIAHTFHCWRGEANGGGYENIPGFCASAMVDRIAGNNFVLNPGRYVGNEEPKDVGEPIGDRIAQLKRELFAAFDECTRLQKRARAALGRLDGNCSRPQLGVGLLGSGGCDVWW